MDNETKTDQVVSSTEIAITFIVDITAVVIVIVGAFAIVASTAHVWGTTVAFTALILYWVVCIAGEYGHLFGNKRTPFFCLQTRYTIYTSAVITLRINTTQLRPAHGVSPRT